MNTQMSNTFTKIRCKIIDDIRMRPYWHGVVVAMRLVGSPALEMIEVDYALFILTQHFVVSR